MKDSCLQFSVVFAAVVVMTESTVGKKKNWTQWIWHESDEKKNLVSSERELKI